MILKDLILKYEFDTIVPDLTGIEAQVKNNLYACKEDFDTLQRMTPGDARGEQIVVSLEVETEESNKEGRTSIAGFWRHIRSLYHL